MIEQLERAAGFERDDPPETKARQARGAAGARHRPARRGRAADRGAARHADGERYPPLDLTPQRQKQRTLEALVDQLEGLAAAQPVLLAYEDVHWIDPTTQELLGLTIERVQRLPVLALITFRPEFVPLVRPAARQRAGAHRLGRREGAALVERVVGDKALPAEVAAQIVAKTDGVPLFVEELTKTVLESGLLRATPATATSWPARCRRSRSPTTLHDSLLARLDRLAPVKEVAQIGAAIGREFSHALLAAVADRPEAELQAALDQLVASELVFRRGTPPEATYSFKHALVQDAAYGTLLKSRRQQLHARIAAGAGGAVPGDGRSSTRTARPPLHPGGSIEKAIDYWYKAGRQAMARSAMVEAARS